MMQPAMRTLPGVTLAAMVAIASQLPAAGQEGKSGVARVRTTVPLTAAAREQFAQRAITHSELPERAAGHRLVPIRVTAQSAGDSPETARTTIDVVVFDHTALEARRIAFDPATNRLLLNERLTGRPQRSDDEMADAIAIVRRDRVLRGLLDAGAALDGGFIVDDPGGSRRRMIQLKMMRGDRRALLRSIVVDLTRGQIASISDTHGGRQ